MPRSIHDLISKREKICLYGGLEPGRVLWNIEDFVEVLELFDVF